MPRQRDELPGYRAVAPSIWERRPPSITEKDLDQTKPDDSPDMILIFSWTGALLRHVSKYTKRYEELYPSSTILVITTHIKDLCWRSSKTKQARLKLAVHRVMQGSKDKRILVHCFSEGGSNKAVEFAEAYYDNAGEKLPVSALCLDSTPGHPRFQKLCGAFSRSLGPNKAVRAIGLVIGTVVLGTIWFSYSAIKGRDNNVISKTRERINDKKYWNVNAPRCYMYSEADDMIHWEDIKDHLAEAAKGGVPVYAMQFANSGHCRHVEKANDAYWEAVMETWEKGNPQLQKRGMRITTIFSDRLSRGTSLLFSIDSTTEMADRLSIPAEKEAFKRLSSQIIFSGPLSTLHPQYSPMHSRKPSTLYRASMEADNRLTLLLSRPSMDKSSLAPSTVPKESMDMTWRQSLAFARKSIMGANNKQPPTFIRPSFDSDIPPPPPPPPAVLRELTQAEIRQSLAVGRKSSLDPNHRESTMDPLMMYLNIRDY